MTLFNIHIFKLNVTLIFIIHTQNITKEKK